MAKRSHVILFWTATILAVNAQADSKKCSGILSETALTISSRGASEVLQQSTGSMIVRSSMKPPTETETRVVKVQVFSRTERQDQLIKNSPDTARGAMAIKDGKIVRIEDSVRSFEFALPKTMIMKDLTVLNALHPGTLIESVYEVSPSGASRSAQTTARVYNGSLIIERWFVVNEGKRNEERIHAKFSFERFVDLGNGKKEFSNLVMLLKIYDPQTNQMYMEGGPIALTTSIAIDAQ